MATTQASANPTQVRSLYRRILRELPSRKPSILRNPSPIQQTIRSSIISKSSESSNSSSEDMQRQLDATDQFIQYLAAQRQYTTLLERYNPGMNLEEEERVRLTARRVGMNLPVEFRHILGGGGGTRDGSNGGGSAGSGQDK